jgi:hypothetical protein
VKVVPLDSAATVVPRKPRSRHSFNENLDEPEKLIEQEPADVEAEVPDEGNAPVEPAEDRSNDATPSAFEDDADGE